MIEVTLIIKRIEYIDIAKGIGIILVVLAHAGSPFSNFIIQFHMPLFFFISGYLYNDVYTNNPIKLIKSKIKGIYLPYIKYGLLLVFLHNIFLKLNIYNNSVEYNGTYQSWYSIKGFIRGIFNTFTIGNNEQLGGAMWFLVSLLMVSIIFGIYKFIINKYLSSKKDLILGLIILLSFIIGYNTKFPRSLSVSLVALIFYYMGYMYHKYCENIKLNSIVSLVAIIIVYFLSLFNKVSMVSNTYTNPVTFIVGSLCGIYFIFYISKVLENTIAKDWLRYLGENTICIIGLHFLSFKLVSLFEVFIYQKEVYLIASFPTLYSYYPWWILYTIAGLGIPIITIKIFDRIKDNIMRFMKRKCI